MPNKMLKIVSPFTFKSNEEDDSLEIEGYASTKDLDRDGDVILPEAWKKGLKGYKKNPIVLAYHQHDRPIGRATKIKVDDDGLKISAKITKAAGDVHGLIKEGILQTFSVGFRPVEADYDKRREAFIIKEAELYEISVVSVPANAAAGFNVAKQFNNNKHEFETFKKEFISNDEIIKEKLMDPKKDTDTDVQPVDLKALAATISKSVKADLIEDARLKSEADEAIKANEAKITATATTAAERLLKDFEERMTDKDQTVATALTDMRDALAEKEAEIVEMRKAEKGKMTFTDGSGKSEITREEKDTAVLVAKCLNKGLTETKFFKSLVEKSGQEHMDTAMAADDEWESSWSTTVENDVRQQLVVEPLFRTFNMPTPTYNFPVNPEAGQAYWIPDSAFRGTGSTGTEEEHILSDRTIIAQKLASKEYIGYEEEEDTILPIVPIIRESIARRMALESDRAILRGEGAANTAQTSSPITGLTGLGVATDVDLAGGVADLSTANDEDLIVDMRESLGLWGTDVSNLVLLVARGLYYSLLKNDDFKTVDVAGIERATLLKGEVGSVYGIRVVISDNFVNTDTVGVDCAVLVNVRNFIVGNLRGIMTETDRNIEEQKNIIVSSRRFAFDEIITAQAAVNLTIVT